MGRRIHKNPVYVHDTARNPENGDRNAAEIFDRLPTTTIPFDRNIFKLVLFVLI